MSLYKHLIIALDGSRTSQQALEHACSLAVISDALMTLVTIADPAEYMSVSPEFLHYTNYEEAARGEGDKLLAQAKNYALAQGVVTVETRLALSSKGVRDMAYKLCEVAEEAGGDLLVLGTHGRTGLKHLLLGSFAEAVMRLSNLPMLVLRSKNEAADTDEDDL